MATTTSPIRFGILGCAEIARKVARAIELAPNAVLVAVGSRSLDKARRFLADNGLDAAVVRAVGSYEAVLDDPVVDAVYVPLPTSLHARWAVAAAEKGKHLLLEKPPALCAAELDLILEACRSHGVQFMDCTMWVHHPRTAKMKEMLSDPARFGQTKTVPDINLSGSEVNKLEEQPGGPTTRSVARKMQQALSMIEEEENCNTPTATPRLVILLTRHCESEGDIIASQFDPP